MNKRFSTAALGTSALALCAAGVLGAGPAAAHDSDSSASGSKRATVLKADLTELNDSGASGKATVVLQDGMIKHINVKARGLTPDAPHAQHIHYGDDALNECPTLAQDANNDGRLNTVEGIPAYGPVVVSLTTRGDTSPASLLAVDRFPVAKDGRYTYKRSNIAFTDVAGTGYQAGGGTAEQIREAIMAGEGVLVIHGIDYNMDGKYSLSEEGFSELDPTMTLPAEATDPAVCGLLH